MHGKDSAWYLVTSRDGKDWYATLQTFNFYQKKSPYNIISLKKDVMIGWVYYSVTINEIGIEALRKLPELDSICLELRFHIEEYINYQTR